MTITSTATNLAMIAPWIEVVFVVKILIEWTPGMFILVREEAVDLLLVGRDVCVPWHHSDFSQVF